MSFKVEPFSKQSFQLGEGPHWHPKYNKLYFVDIPGSLVGTLDVNGKLEVLYEDEQKRAVTAVLPVAGSETQVVVTIDTSVYLIENGKATLIDQIDTKGVRFNDAKCDPRGRLFLGTMSLESTPGTILKHEAGVLYVLKNKKLVKLVDKVTLSNGLAWSLDETKFYYIDSIKRQIYVFDYAVETGSLSNQKVFFDLNTDSTFKPTDLPDGMTIDVKGNLWVAIFKGKRIVNIDTKTGKVIQTIDMPTTLITSVSFGGPQLNELYVTCSEKYLDAETKAKEPLAGYIFKVTSTDPDFRGYKPQTDVQL